MLHALIKYKEPARSRLDSIDMLCRQSNTPLNRRRGAKANWEQLAFSCQHPPLRIIALHAPLHKATVLPTKYND